MATFSKISKERLATCHIDLQRLFNEVIKYRDCRVLVGHRDREAQEAAFDAGLTRQHYPKSTHNKLPSEGVDVAPWPIDFENVERNYYFAGFVMGIAKKLDINIRCGADWDGDGNPRNQTLFDPNHFEIKQKEGRVFD